MHMYPSGDQIREREKNIGTVTNGETFSDLWMDNLIYTTTIHASHHLCANRNLDGYRVVVYLLMCWWYWSPHFAGCCTSYWCVGSLIQMPSEQLNHWMICMTCYTTVVNTELFSYVESLWETAEKDRKIQNDHRQKIQELKNKLLIQGCSLEDHKDIIHKLSGIVKKQEKALNVLTAEIIYLETWDDNNGERLNNHSYCLGVLESSQLVRELGSNSWWLDLILLF